MPELVLVSDSLAGGGAERVMATLANYLGKRRKVSLVTLFDMPDRYQLDPEVERIRLVLPGSPVWRGQEYPRLALLNQGIALGKLFRRLKPRAALTFMETANILGVIAGLWSGVPVAISERCHPEQLVLHRMHKRIYRRLLYPLASAFVAQSSPTAEWARRYLPRRRIHVLPNPVRFPAPTVPAPQPQPVILGVGRLAEGKGQSDLLEAFARVAERFPEWRVRLVGEGPLQQQLLERSQQADLRGRVELAGWCQDMVSEYRRASLLAHCSHHEGQPNVVLEALWFGLPAVVTECFPDCRQLLADGSEVIWSPVRDIAGIARGLERLLTDPALREQMGRQGQQRVTQWGVEVCGPRWERLLLEM